MALVVADRVKDTTTTTGTGTVTLSGTAPTGYQNFAVIGNGNTTYYTIAGGSEWEVGVGTYATSGPTLARTTVLASTNGGNAVSFSAGTKDVFVTYPAEIATMLTNPVPTNGGVVYGTGTAIGVSAAGVVNGYQFLQSAGAASPTWVQINSFKDVATAPTSPTPIEGDRFFDNTTGIDYTYITDVDGSQWVETAPGNLASVAGGSSTQVQYNNAGILGGITGATTNGTVLTLTTPVLGAATGTSLALNGATLGSNALAVTGTTALSGLLTAAGGVSSTLVTDATSSTTGSIISAGGISCQKQAVVGTNLGVGSAPLSPLANRADVTINGASAGAILTLGNAGTRVGYLLTDGTNVGLASETATGYVRFLTNSAERMQITSAGLVGIGCTPTNTLDVSRTTVGTYFTGNGGDNSARALAFTSSTTTNSGDTHTINAKSGTGIIAFAISSTEAARIDTSGNLLINKTVVSSTGNGVQLLASGFIGSTLAGSTSATDTLDVYSTAAGAFRFYVDMGGTIHATSATITAISDRTLKTNIRPLDTGLKEIMGLQPRRFDWINGDGENVVGFVAQEVEEVLPELVTSSKYSVDENGDTVTKKAVKTGDMIPTLVKAIQELTTRLAALENK